MKLEKLIENTSRTLDESLTIQICISDTEVWVEGYDWSSVVCTFDSNDGSLSENINSAVDALICNKG